MAATNLQHWLSRVSRGLGRRTRVALVISGCLHLCAVAVLALMDVAATPAPVESTVSATIIEPVAASAPFECITVDLKPTGDSAAGGSRYDTPDIVIPTGGAPGPKALSDWTGSGTPDGVLTGPGVALTELVSPLGGGAGGGSRGSGEGNGIGDGVGDGTGTSFFGLTARGKSFVFVVDASSSMRRPSHGPERTLFNRVKLEIMHSIRQLTEEQRFFIVFFSDSHFPMPATSLVAATDEAQARYLRWMAEMKSGGQTDPEGAIQFALQLQPDVVYFLTDGEFKPGLVKRIAAMNRSGVTINTVCFGGTEDNNVSLRRIAEQNGGTYHFVPIPAPVQETAARAPGGDAAATP